jgi:hypothetical protein
VSALRVIRTQAHKAGHRCRILGSAPGPWNQHSSPVPRNLHLKSPRQFCSRCLVQTQSGSQCCQNGTGSSPAK